MKSCSVALLALQQGGMPRAALKALAHRLTNKLIHALTQAPALRRRSGVSAGHRGMTTGRPGLLQQDHQILRFALEACLVEGLARQQIGVEITGRTALAHDVEQPLPGHLAV